MEEAGIVPYLPILTTVIAVPFAASIWRRYRRRGGHHLAWWSGGVLAYGLGTATESWITLVGWSPVAFKLWYLLGALLGAAPLAQGTVWLLLRRRTARVLTVALVALLVPAMASVLASPTEPPPAPALPSGEAFAWQWVRAFSPVINLYALVFLVGGAALSAVRFRRQWQARAGGPDGRIARDRALGNGLIAVGALLPAIGGTAARAGHTEILYLTELAGIVLIWGGYWLNVRRRSAAAV